MENNRKIDFPADSCYTDSMQPESSRSLSSRLFSVFTAAFTAAAGLFVLLMLPAGCSRKRSQDVLFHAINTQPFSSLDPAVEQSDGVNILQNVYETLTVYDSTDGQVKPCLAESWSSNATRTVWTFNLRRDVIFHDGNALTAAAVKKSIDRVMFLGKGAAYIWDCVSSLEAQNTYTIIFRLSYAADLPLIASSNSAAYILSPAAASKDESWFNEGHDAGSGPYRIAAVSKSSVTLEAFEGYRNGWQKRRFKKVFIEEVPTMERRSAYMSKAAADIVFFPDSRMLSSLDSYTAAESKTWQSLVMMFNTEKEPCTSEDFRKALAYAFPSEQAVEQIMSGRASYAWGMVPSGFLSHDESLPAYRCDLNAARTHLERSAQNGGTLTLTYHDGSPEISEMLRLYRQNLETLGINLILLKLNRDEQLKMARNPDPKDRQDILLMNWWPDNADPTGTFTLLLSDQGLDKGFNFSYLHDPEIMLALQVASILALENKQEAAKIYWNLQQKVFNRCYLAFLYHSDLSFAVKKGISGVSINPAYANCIYYYDLQYDPATR